MGLVLVVSTFVGPQRAMGQANQEFRIDSAASTVAVNVGRAGLFAFAGHDHEVIAPAMQGAVFLDSEDVSRSRLTLQFDATAMKVTGRGEPADDVAEVQRVMLSDRVLDVQRHPTITFESERISVRQRSSDQLRLQVDGKLTLRGATRAVSIPVDVRLTADRLAATGTTTLRQTAFGINPVTAVAGTVRVKDEVSVAFTIVGRRLSSAKVP